MPHLEVGDTPCRQRISSTESLLKNKRQHNKDLADEIKGAHGYLIQFSEGTRFNSHKYISRQVKKTP